MSSAKSGLFMLNSAKTVVQASRIRIQSNFPLSMSPNLQHGHYARKQIFSKDRLISWSHRSRFDLALKLAREIGGRRLLDYGCGDGTFLSLMMSQIDPDGIQEAVGAEVGMDQISDCRRRLGTLDGVSFVGISDLDRAEFSQAFDMVVCTEVLEHVVDREEALNRLKRVLAPSGHLIISVPVETGFPLLIKQTARRIAGWRGLGDYPGMSPYSWGELLRSFFAANKQHMIRPIHGVPEGRPFHDHKGFNWKVLKAEVELNFEIQRMLTSPLSLGGTQLASQVWFLATPRKELRKEEVAYKTN